MTSIDQIHCTFMPANACEFCGEINDHKRTRFHGIYSPSLPTRIIRKTKDFVVFPTLGQLFTGSLLIVSKAHVERVSDIRKEIQSEMVCLLNDLKSSLKQFGNVLLFEHGAKSDSLGGCGIYHAHIHLVPLPAHVSSNELFKLTFLHAESLMDAWHKVNASDEYLVVEDCYGNIDYTTADKSGVGFGSQYARRRLTEHFQLDHPWDWRAYKWAEPKLLQTLQSFQVK
jgi:diadenosine tetraphosphate (Ap4A) HIT family hydrolase